VEYIILLRDRDTIKVMKLKWEERLEKKVIVIFLFWVKPERKGNWAFPKLRKVGINAPNGT